MLDGHFFGRQIGVQVQVEMGITSRMLRDCGFEAA